MNFLIKNLVYNRLSKLYQASNKSEFYQFNLIFQHCVLLDNYPHLVFDQMNFLWMKRKLLRSHIITIPQFFYHPRKIFFCQQKLSHVTMMSFTRDERMQLAFMSNKSKAKCLCDCLSHSNSFYFNEEWNSWLYCNLGSSINDVNHFLYK